MSWNPWRVNDEMTTGRLNDQEAEARAARVIIAPGSGLVGTQLDDGHHLVVPEVPEGWYRVASAAAAKGVGWYNLVEQVDTPSGGWADGPRHVVAREAQLNPSVPTGTSPAPVVYAWRSTLRWDFQYGACSS